MLTLGVWYVNLMAVLFVGVCLFMMLVILIQKPRSGGLVGAFGGSGAVQQAFGSKVGDLLTWFTVGCFIAFLLLAMGLTWAIKPANSKTADKTIQTQTTTAPAPGSTTPAPGTPGSADTGPKPGATPTPTPAPGTPGSADTQPAK